MSENVGGTDYRCKNVFFHVEEKGKGGGQEAQVGKIAIPQPPIEVFLDYHGRLHCNVGDARDP